MWLEHLTHLWGAHLALVHGLGLLHAVHAVLKVRSPQGAIGWALALASFPYAAVPLYWVLGGPNSSATAMPGRKRTPRSTAWRRRRSRR